MQVSEQNTQIYSDQKGEKHRLESVLLQWACVCVAQKRSQLRKDSVRTDTRDTKGNPRDVRVALCMFYKVLIADYQFLSYGFTTLPIKRMVPVVLSRIR